MGVFHTLEEVINRTSKPLSVRYDGQDTILLPNYTPEGKFLPNVHNMIPDITVDYAKVQNTLMGSESAWDPSDFEVLVGRLARPGQKQKDDISYCEQSDEPTRVKLEEYLADDKLKVVRHGNIKARRSKRDEAVIPPGVDFERTNPALTRS